MNLYFKHRGRLVKAECTEELYDMATVAVYLRTAEAGMPPDGAVLGSIPCGKPLVTESLSV